MPYEMRRLDKQNLSPASSGRRVSSPPTPTTSPVLDTQPAARDRCEPKLLPHSLPSPTPPTPLNGGKDALVLHSHLTPLAAAVDPAASHALNHSCAPNAVPLFVFAPATPPRMEVVLVRDLAPGDDTDAFGRAKALVGRPA
ncbi:hypothetical protein AURDEDRAFT_185236 [Auricularia subglabra TFB-10046 SS5]|nr:hypothetical protein AURDEDRAFT_185236 [Auricularia subglabra TFB-10046 SS5]